jgi:hypothetical protein
MVLRKKYLIKSGKLKGHIALSEKAMGLFCFDIRQENGA